jgi:hypothetical protein
VRFARLMGLLVARGCVVGRSARKPGRLSDQEQHDEYANDHVLDVLDRCRMNRNAELWREIAQDDRQNKDQRGAKK